MGVRWNWVGWGGGLPFEHEICLPFKEKKPLPQPEWCNNTITTPTRKKTQLVLLMTIASKRISKCNYVSSYEIHEVERTNGIGSTVYAPKLVWMWCVSVLSFMLWFASGWSYVWLHPFCHYHTHTGEHMGNGTPKAAEERFFSNTLLFCEISELKKQETKWEEKIGSSGYCVLHEQEKSDESERKERTFGCNAIYEECIKKDYNFCLFTCTN